MENNKKIYMHICRDCKKEIQVSGDTHYKGLKRKYYLCIDCSYKERGRKLSKHQINMNQAEKDRIKKQSSETKKKNYNNKSDEEKDAIKNNMRKVRNNFFDSLDESGHQEMKIKRKKGLDKYWNGLSDEEFQKKVNTSIENLRIVNENKEYYRPIQSKAASDRWKNMSTEKRNEKMKKIWDGNKYWRSNMSSKELSEYHHKFIISSQNNNNLIKLFDETFYKSLMSDKLYFKKEHLLSNNGISHSWDYGIFHKSDNELIMVIDIDGSYYHADGYDYDGMHSRIEYDEKRILSIPKHIKWLLIYENQFELSLKSLPYLLQINYDQFILNQFEIYKNTVFPFHEYTILELIKSYKQLLNMNTDINNRYIKKCGGISINTRLGDRLISHFHHSIYYAHQDGFKYSPYDVWYNKSLLKHHIENHGIIHNKLNTNKILQGFNVSKIAPKVSVFSAGRAKLLINKYLSEYDTIFDPFSGFSGRMLGSISLDKEYIGQDISSMHVKESNEIISFLKDNGFNINATVYENDIMNSYGEYDCLFTCPPYRDNEFWNNINNKIISCDDWIDICINHYKCKKYLFVIDDTEKYHRYIVDEIINKSHFGTNTEKVILI